MMTAALAKQVTIARSTILQKLTSRRARSERGKPLPPSGGERYEAVGRREVQWDRRKQSGRFSTIIGESLYWVEIERQPKGGFKVYAERQRTGERTQAARAENLLTTVKAGLALARHHDATGATRPPKERRTVGFMRRGGKVVPIKKRGGGMKTKVEQDSDGTYVGAYLHPPLFPKDKAYWALADRGYGYKTEADAQAACDRAVKAYKAGPGSCDYPSLAYAADSREDLKVGQTVWDANPYGHPRKMKVTWVGSGFIAATADETSGVYINALGEEAIAGSGRNVTEGLKRAIGAWAAIASGEEESAERPEGRKREPVAYFRRGGKTIPIRKASIALTDSQYESILRGLSATIFGATSRKKTSAKSLADIGTQVWGLIRTSGKAAGDVVADLKRELTQQKGQTSKQRATLVSSAKAAIAEYNKAKMKDWQASEKGKSSWQRMHEAGEARYQQFVHKPQRQAVTWITIAGKRIPIRKGTAMSKLVDLRNGTIVGVTEIEKATGRGRMGGPYSAGPGGKCVCPECGETIDHEAGEPCTDLKCPKCGAAMERKLEKKTPKLGSGERFAQLETKIAARGNVRDPGAVAATIGRKKWGKGRMQQLALAAKRRKKKAAAAV